VGAIAVYKSAQPWKYASSPQLIRNRFDGLAQELSLNYETEAIYEVGYTIGEYIEKTWGERALGELIKSNGDFSVLTDTSFNEVF
jgi:hypothetical protein